jgi:hypothetical protein
MAIKDEKFMRSPADRMSEIMSMIQGISDYKPVPNEEIHLLDFHDMATGHMTKTDKHGSVYTLELCFTAATKGEPDKWTLFLCGIRPDFDGAPVNYEPAGLSDCRFSGIHTAILGYEEHGLIGQTEVLRFLRANEPTLYGEVKVYGVVDWGNYSDPCYAIFPKVDPSKLILPISRKNSEIEAKYGLFGHGREQAIAASRKQQNLNVPKEKNDGNQR